MNRFIRPAFFLGAAALHLVLLFFLVFRMDRVVQEPEPPLTVMKLTDLREAAPPPERPPSPEPLSETIAETVLETETLPETARGGVTAEPDFLAMHQVSRGPVFSEDLIRSRLEYPPMARRSGIEGMVYLELLVDAQGRIRRIIILKEEPADRGFGEAAVRAFQGLEGRPAEANGVPAAVRLRYPVRFRLR